MRYYMGEVPQKLYSHNMAKFKPRLSERYRDDTYLTFVEACRDVVERHDSLQPKTHEEQED